jgi:hypothetical protein
MSCWEIIRQQYPSKYNLTEQELAHVPYTSQEYFAINLKGERLLFMRFGTKAIYSRGVGHLWKYEDGWETVDESHLRASFVDYTLVNNLDCFTGTAEFRGKEIKYNMRNYHWIYLNNRPVNFHTPSERHTLAEEEDTEQVEELLETTERTIIAAT